MSVDVVKSNKYINISPFSIKQTTFYLYEIEGVLYNITDGDLFELEGVDLTENNMIEYGNDTYDADILTSVKNIKLHLYEQNPSVLSYNFNYTALYKGQLITQGYDFDATNPSALVITAIVNSNDIFRVLLSNDSGENWYTYSDNEVSQVSIDSIAERGMSNIQVNSMSAEALGRIINGTDKLRMAIYMKQAKSNVKMKLDHIRFEYKV